MTDEQKAKSAFVINHLFPVVHAIDPDVYDLEYIVEEVDSGSLKEINGASITEETVIIDRFKVATCENVTVTGDDLYATALKVIKRLDGKKEAAAKLALHRRQGK